MAIELPPNNEHSLRIKLGTEPDCWETRKHLAHVLYDKNLFEEAAEVIWAAPQIPSTDLEIAFAARILAKAKPHRAIRLLIAVLDSNKGKAVQNMGMANALLHHGMVLQAVRFYSAALAIDPSLVNPDLEHFILWTDDEMTMWADFKGRRPKLGDLPWMVRDPKEALRLTSRVNHHTSPVYVPNLPRVPGEELRHELYKQTQEKNGKITPPPAVTIPIDRVNPKDRLFDSKYGAEIERSETSPLVESVNQHQPPINSPIQPPVKVASESPAPVPARAPAPLLAPGQPRVPVPVLAPVAVAVPVPVAAPTPVPVPVLVSENHTHTQSSPVPTIVPTSVLGIAPPRVPGIQAPATENPEPASTPTRRRLITGTPDQVNLHNAIKKGSLQK